MVYRLLYAEGRHERGTAVIAAYHNLRHQFGEVRQYQVPEPGIVALHHIRPVTPGLAVIVIPAGQEGLVVVSQLAVTVIIGDIPYHAIPGP